MAIIFRFSNIHFSFCVPPVADWPHGSPWRGRGWRPGGRGGAEESGGGEVGKLLPVDVSGSVRDSYVVCGAAPRVPTHTRVLPRE